MFIYRQYNLANIENLVNIKSPVKVESLADIGNCIDIKSLALSSKLRLNLIALYTF